MTKRKAPSKTALLGTGGLGIIAVAIISKWPLAETAKQEKPEQISQHAAGGGVNVFAGPGASVSVNQDPKVFDLLKEMRDSLKVMELGKGQPNEVDAQREAVEELEERPDIRKFEMPKDAPAQVRIALGEVGVAEIEGDKSHPRILEYLKATGLTDKEYYTDETPWSACFISWVLQQAGFRDAPRSASIRNIATWGKNVESPTLGAIVIVNWSTLSGPNHGGFFLQDLGRYVLMVGGNVNDSVLIQAVPKSAVAGYRMPQDG